MSHEHHGESMDEKWSQIVQLVVDERVSESCYGCCQRSIGKQEAANEKILVFLRKKCKVDDRRICKVAEINQIHVQSLADVLKNSNKYQEGNQDWWVSEDVSERISTKEEAEQHDQDSSQNVRNLIHAPPERASLHQLF